ncbi:MAG: MgtC/SapB family protein [Clostridiales bacterium]|nr:MgtC/SapB family protein [Clostridiales bacterium]
MSKNRNAMKDPLIIGIIFGIVITIIIFKFIDKSQLMLGMIDMSVAENMFKLVFAAFSGGIIGFERESKNRPAGLRTHALVSIGAVLVMIIPFGIIADGNNVLPFDVTRLGAQVISGIGFLGAGTIIRNGNSVKGLTTAASLWVAAIIGLTIGAEIYFISFLATAIVIFVLQVFGDFEHRQTFKNRNLEFLLQTTNLIKQIGLVNKAVEDFGLKLTNIEIIENKIEDDNIKLIVRVNVPNRIKTEDLVSEFERFNTVVQVMNY